jgi:uncharacterized membrane protein SpoIIM required for sporulation
MPTPTATSTPFGAGPQPSRSHDARRRTTASATVTALLLAGAGVAVGYGSFTATTPDPQAPLFALDSTGAALFAEIAARNVGAALLLFSGVATLGATTVVGIVFVSAWIGAGFHALSDETGLRHLDPLVLTYLPLEFGGLLLAAVAGLLPLAETVRRFLSADPSGGGAVRTVPAALRLLALAISCIVAGALVETLVIHRLT